MLYCYPQFLNANTNAEFSITQFKNSGDKDPNSDISM